VCYTKFQGLAPIRRRGFVRMGKSPASPDSWNELLLGAEVSDVDRGGLTPSAWSVLPTVVCVMLARGTGRPDGAHTAFDEVRDEKKSFKVEACVVVLADFSNTS
jgi:hypothetical protein